MAARRLLWCQPRSLSPRISAQQAAFVFGEAVDEPCRIDPARAGRGQPRRDRRGARRCRDPRLGGAEGRAQRHLGASVRFSEESLFPDFDGFALANGVDRPLPA